MGEVTSFLRFGAQFCLSSALISGPPPGGYRRLRPAAGLGDLLLIENASHKIRWGLTPTPGLPEAPRPRSARRHSHRPMRRKPGSISWSFSRETASETLSVMKIGAIGSF